MAVRSPKIAAVLGMALCASLAAFAQAPLSTAVIQEEWPVHGLAAPAEIIVDHWGIPHIFAQSSRDAYFLQGYNAARDRLWQIDLWRKRGLGLLSKSFGPAYVEQDRAARLFLYRGDMEKEWRSYAPDARASTCSLIDDPFFRALAARCNRRADEAAALGLRAELGEALHPERLEDRGFRWIVLHPDLDPSASAELSTLLRQTLGEGERIGDGIRWDLSVRR